jgi:hypothetical protein
LVDSFQLEVSNQSEAKNNDLTLTLHLQEVRLGIEVMLMTGKANYVFDLKTLFDNLCFA